jgi:hypothetical protein
LNKSSGVCIRLRKRVRGVVVPKNMPCILF